MPQAAGQFVESRLTDRAAFELPGVRVLIEAAEVDELHLASTCRGLAVGENQRVQPHSGAGAEPFGQYDQGVQEILVEQPATDSAAARVVQRSGGGEHDAPPAAIRRIPKLADQNLG